MCGWDRDSSVCRSYQPSLVHDPTGVKDNLCQVRSEAQQIFSFKIFFLQASIFKRKLIANFGQSIHLSCSVGRSVSTQVSSLSLLSHDPVLSPYHDLNHINHSCLSVSGPLSKHSLSSPLTPWPLSLSQSSSAETSNV